MSEETIVAVFDSAEQADAAVRDLVAAEVPESAISRHARGTASMTQTDDPAVAGPRHEEGFWSRLFGGDRDYDHDVYDRSVDSGSTVISVRVSDAHVMLVSEILDRHHPIDIDERASTYGYAGTTATAGAAGVAPGGYTETQYDSPIARSGSDLTDTGPVAPTAGLGTTGVGADESETLRLAEERLTVGKRLVNRGSTRVRRYVVESPVEEQVTLHEERVTLDRRPVTGTAAADAGNFTDRTIEMTETREEAVVSKTAQVVEEVRLRREGVDSVETVRDTVRREEVEVETVPDTTTTTTAPRR